MRRLLLSLAVLAPVLFVATGVYQIIYTDWILVCRANPSRPIWSCMKHKSEALRFIETLEAAGWTCEVRRAKCRP